MKTVLIAAAAAALLTAGPLPAAAQAQQPGATRTELLRYDLSIPGREAHQSRVDLVPGAVFPPHKHAGEELIYVLEGTFEYVVDGKPVTVRAGEALFIPAGTVHSARNVGTGTARELATHIVEKGKPLVILAP